MALPSVLAVCQVHQDEGAYRWFLCGQQGMDVACVLIGPPWARPRLWLDQSSPWGSALYLVAVMSRIHNGVLDPAERINVNVSITFGAHSGVLDQV